MYSDFLIDYGNQIMIIALSVLAWVVIGTGHILYWYSQNRVYFICQKTWGTYVVILSGPIGVIAEIIGYLIYRNSEGRLPDFCNWWDRRHLIFSKDGKVEIDLRAKLFLDGISIIHRSILIFRNMGVPEKIISKFSEGVRIFENQAATTINWHLYQAQLEKNITRINQEACGHELPAAERWKVVSKRCTVMACKKELVDNMRLIKKTLDQLKGAGLDSEGLKSICEGMETLTAWVKYVDDQGQDLAAQINAILSD